MAIETICKGCARKLRVGDEYAGRKARCPHCKTVYTVPSADADLPHEPSGAPGGWRLRTKDGAVFGPVSKSELDGWVQEGRLDSTSQLQQYGEETWRPASEFYPSLAPTPVSDFNPLSSEPTFSPPASNPYSSPRATGTPMARGYHPHRGGLILTLSLLGFACCQLFSIAAWVMGYADMKEINAGRIDPEGRGLTQAGMIIGIIGTGLMVLGIVAQIIIVLIAIASEM
ncbi:MAG: hypothetical protein WD070_12285 [Pirellulaceae bacterium]